MTILLRSAPALFTLAAATSLTAPALAAEPSQESAHVVEPGETLNGIANRAGVPAEAIAKANNLEAPYVVRVGETLAIPRPDAPAPRSASTPANGEYTVTYGETLNGIANRTGVKPRALARANGLSEPYALQVGQTLVVPRKGSNGRTAARTIAPRASDNSAETYTVTSGETLGGIANRTGVPRVLIAEANGLQPPFIVRTGQVLHIPRTRHHTVASGESAFGLSLKYGVPWEQIAVASGIAADTPLTPGQKLLIPSVLTPPAATGTSRTAKPTASPAPAQSSARFLWPVKGPIRRGFATGTNYHDGIDIAAPRGAEVRAAAAGTVRFAAMEKQQFGNLVVIDHGDGWFTAYAFLSRITVRKGATVAKGERIGLVGDTGLAKGNELHFEIRKNGKPVNPVDELPKAP